MTTLTAPPVPRAIQPEQVFEIIAPTLGYCFKLKVLRHHPPSETKQIMRCRAIVAALCVKHCIHSRAEIAREMRLTGTSDISHAVKLCNKLIAQDAGFAKEFAELDRTVMEWRVQG